MPEKFDLIVIGSGPAGTTVATSCADAGMSVAVADSLFGGTCALRGCTPKKAMESVTTIWWETHDLAGHGPAKPAYINWPDLLNHKQAFTALIPSGKRDNFRDSGIELIEGNVAFTGSDTITDGNGEWKAKNIVIASGARPRTLDIPGSEHLLTNADFFELPKLPKRIVFAGGGYVGFELSNIVAACGSKTSIISRAEKPLGGFDPDLVSQFMKATSDKGIDLRLGFTVRSIRKSGNAFEVTIDRAGPGKPVKIEADGVINSAGRVPNIDKLNLVKAGVQYSDRGIATNKHLQCEGNENIYAIGDVNGKYPFTPVGEYEGEIAAYNILHKGKKQIDYHNIPTILYTHPKLASVGRSEHELKEENIEFNTYQQDTGEWLIEKALHNAHAGYKVFVGKKDDKILGAHLLGSKSDEMINFFTLAMHLGITASQLADFRPAFPTNGSWLPGMVSG